MPIRMIHQPTATPTEESEQRSIFQWAHYAAAEHPELRLLFAIPNGGYRSKATAGRMKATGTKPGVPDMMLPVPRGEYHGLWIELKRAKGGRVSDEQHWWIDELNRCGYMAVVAKGSEMAIRIIEAYLKDPILVYAQTETTVRPSSTAGG